MRLNRFFMPLTLLFGFSYLTNPLSASESAGLSVSVSISPVPSRPDDCLCRAEITDLADGKLIASPNLIVKKGESGELSIGERVSDSIVDHNPETILFTFSIDKSGTSATYSVTYSKNKKVVGVQKGAISIR